ncbi:putative F-box family protein [Hibiscus syriacus]|uniref:F-box family protein n=1 Tax=Hibiscus syriacus TaxID=106335 RepID=A0A6A2WD20_HIBSY|nr:transcription termination factor MTERF5, chloroplastic-like [Hibiscus syriacus]KAE8653895.1 putative F-box family protein [Hibiscus syriacus]
MAPPIRSLISLSLNKSSCFRKPISCYPISVAFFVSAATQESKSSFSLAYHLIEKHNLSHEIAVKTASSLSNVKDPSKCDNIISFLKESGFSKSHIEETLQKKPKLLNSSLEKTIQPKFKFFRDLGFSTNDFADLIATDPSILVRSVNDRIVPSVLYLKSVLGSNANVVKLLKILSWFLAFDLQKTMMPNIEFLRSCGVSSSQIVSFLFPYPRFFLHKLESIKQFVKRADDMGIDRKSTMFIVAIRTLASMSEDTWEQKLKLFRKLGFSEDDINSTFRRIPHVFSVSERKIKEISDFLLTRKNVGISLIISYPMVFTYSLEHRLKPRLQVIEILESKNLLRRKVSLSTIFNMSEKNFRVKYVCPYLKELENASIAIVDHKC